MARRWRSSPASSSACSVPQVREKPSWPRLVAGLENRDDGEIYFNGRIVHTLPPHERRVGLVFPDFALWPGMTVAENVAYPIKLNGSKEPERGRRVGEILTMMRIDSLAGKKPEQISPAQSLRVALARAIVTGPELLILDEPLEQFDSRGREEVWDEIRRLRGELGVTTLLLTRVVPEALAHADRLAVMDLGRILQVGPPQELYNHPVDVFVARLLGPTNLLQGQIDGNSSSSRREVVVRTPLGRLVAKAAPSASSLPQGISVTISIRPETLSLGPFDSCRLEPFSRHDRTDHLPWRHPSTRSAWTRRLADHRQSAPEPVFRSPRGPEPDPLGFTGIRDPVTWQIRGRQSGLINDLRPEPPPCRSGCGSPSV